MIANVVRRVKAQHRLRAIWVHAKDKKICEPDTVDDNEQGDATDEAEYARTAGQMKGHGGCGHEQPLWRKKGLKLTGVWKPTDKAEVSFHRLYEGQSDLSVGGGRT